MKHAFAKNIHKGEDAWMQHRDLKWGGSGTLTSEGTGNLNHAASSIQEKLLTATASAALGCPQALPATCSQHQPQLTVVCQPLAPHNHTMLAAAATADDAVTVLSALELSHMLHK